MFKIIYRIFKMSGKQKPKYILSIIFAFFESSFANVPLGMLLVMLYSLIDGSLTKDLCLTLFIGMVAGIALRALFKYLTDSRQQGTGFVIFADERKKMGDRLKRYPMGYYSQDGVGTISSVMTSDLLFIEDNGVGAMGNFISAYIGTIVSLIFITILDYRIGIVLAISLGLCAILVMYLRKKSIDGAKEMQEIQKDMAGSVIEYIKGIPVIKAFNLVEGNHKKTARDFKRFHDIQLDYEVTIIKIVAISWAIASIATGIIVYFTGNFAINNTIALPIAILFIMMSFQIFTPITLITQTVATISLSGDGLNRYQKVLDMPIIDENGKDIPLHNFDIEFKNVSFGYDKREILHNLSFTCKENTMTALVGRSGSGKSTIVNLLARFWDIEQGEITIGGVNIKELSIDSLYKNIAMVFQNVYLFNDTVYNNIVFGNKNASKENVIEACKKARCHDFIMSLENGYETEIAEGGISLSGGEKQRISIARAILKNAPIVLLDEATASIDPENEAYIQEAISELIKSKTLIVIAHKLSSIKYADQILVVNEGNINEQGKHDELMNLDKEYAHLWNLRKESKSWEIK